MRSKGLIILTVLLALILAALVGYVIWRNTLPNQGFDSESRLQENAQGIVTPEGSEASTAEATKNTTVVTAVPEESPSATTSSVPLETDVDEKDPVVPTTVGTTPTEPGEAESTSQTEPPETGSGLDDNELPPM